MGVLSPGVSLRLSTRHQWCHIGFLAGTSVSPPNIDVILPSSHPASVSQLQELSLFQHRPMLSQMTFGAEIGSIWPLEPSLNETSVWVTIFEEKVG